MALVAPMLEYLGLGGLYFIEIDTIEDNETGHLRMRWWPYSPKTLGESVDDEDIEETFLLSGISEVQWSYFGPGESEQDSDWHDQWENKSQRPLLVRLRLLHQGEPWPELVATVFNYSTRVP